MSPQDFAAKWRKGAQHLSERAAAQSHFIDLCQVLGLQDPTTSDPTGLNYAFEKHVRKVSSKDKGFADVWRRGYFGWEYKREGRKLEDAYRQLLLYREDLDNPPLLIVCDLVRFEVHTNFTGTTKKIYSFTLDDLERGAALESGVTALEVLRFALTDPDTLNPRSRREKVTREATARVGAVAQRLQARGHDPEAVAHFMMQLVFALFAEDAALLPRELVTRILEKTKNTPERAKRYLDELFEAMSHGGEVLLEDVRHFNGGLFDGRSALPLEKEDIESLLEAARLDWAEVEPAIFGTLFERSLDPAKRSQLGAHYTSREDILRMVEPVILGPLRREWDTVRAGAEVYLSSEEAGAALELLPSDPKRPEALRRERSQRTVRVFEPLNAFLSKLHSLKVLDPACGSGNFLYVAMQGLKDLERDVLNFAAIAGAPGLPLLSPKQFYGYEINIFAHELASVVVWIGYLQWNRANGFPINQTPILERLNTIVRRDALLEEDGTEFEWVEADYIVGNPPFLGDKKMRSELGDAYVKTLRETYKGRVPGGADLVCYWFEKARALIARGHTQRAGLIATNSIRGGKNRAVLEAIKASGDIFTAWSDEPWVLEGAAVRVSLVAFDGGGEPHKTLNGLSVPSINPDLSALPDLAQAVRLRENLGLSFFGIQKGGAFDIPGLTARGWLNSGNPDGKSNSEVLRPFLNAVDLVQRPSDTWLIDFAQMSEAEAEGFLVPFAHVIEKVKPSRIQNKDVASKKFWWLAQRSRPDMRKAIAPLDRYLVTPHVSKHRLFIWAEAHVIPSNLLIVVARDDDFSFGVLQSSFHTFWALAMCTWMGTGNDPRYTSGPCFETFPFPRPSSAGHAEVEKWAKYLDTVRSSLLKADPKATLTGLYNALEALRMSRDSSHPVYPLLIAHEKLDAAVAAAYGWDWPLEEEEVLSRLLALNLERAALEGGAAGQGLQSEIPEGDQP